MRIIYESGNFRIIEHVDIDFDLCNILGDSYNPDCHPDIPAEQLAQEEKELIELVNSEGVFGYELERWNSNVNCGWEHVDSCWGFVGQYSESDERFKHYIVGELMGLIK